MLVRVLAVGDVVSEPGLRHLEKHLRSLQKCEGISFTVVNGENAASVGLTPEQAWRIYDAGADVVTLGNHTFGKMQIADFLDDTPWLLRPANFTGRAPGRGCGVYDLGGVRIRVMNLIGRCDLSWGADNPFTTADRLLAAEQAELTVVDFHAQATSEKLAMGYYLDGRVSALWGTHTHVPTADERVYPASLTKIMTCLMLSAGGAVSLALLNKYIQFSATSRGLTREENSLCYKWRLGNIYYTKCGSGKPLLLIHDLHFASSGYEWESIREQLSRSYTVYTLDLLGCGRSEKPNLTYTNYLFVQLICDFIKSEIGHRTNILSTGDSAALSIMACSNSPELFDQIMLINPSSLTDCCQLPGKNAKLYKLLLDLPLAGTLIYHIACSRSMIEEAFRTKYFYNPYTVKPVQIDRSHEAAHLGECPKAIFSSIECRYTKCNISNALRKIDNSIFIIGGSEEPMIEATIQDYKIYNSAIESSIIPKTKHLPQLEQPDAVMDAIHMFFS